MRRQIAHHHLRRRGHCRSDLAAQVTMVRMGEVKASPFDKLDSDMFATPQVFHGQSRVDEKSLAPYPSHTVWIQTIKSRRPSPNLTKMKFPSCGKSCARPSTKPRSRPMPTALVSRHATRDGSIDPRSVSPKPCATQRELYEKYGILKDVMVHPSAQKFIRILEKISQVR